VDLEFLFWYILEEIKSGNMQMILWLFNSLFNIGFFMGLLRIVIKGEKI